MVRNKLEYGRAVERVAQDKAKYLEMHGKGLTSVLPRMLNTEKALCVLKFMFSPMI